MNVISKDLLPIGVLIIHSVICGTILTRCIRAGMHEVDLVLQRFDSLIEPFEELMLRIGDKTFLPINELREAQAQFRSIKENLDALYKDLQRRQMTDIEKRFLLRPVAKARSKLHAKWNSNPFKSQWFPQLYDAKDDLKRMRFELEEFRKKI